MHRRDVVLAGLALPLLGRIAREPEASLAAAPATGATPFDPQVVRQLARDLAQKPYKPPDTGLPPQLKDLSYDAYRKIRFLPDRALWRGDKLLFQIQFFHRGFYFSNRVDLYEVDNGRARRIPYSSSMFSFDGIAPPDANVDLGFAGFRIHGPINRPDYYDEVAVFLGASYFRAVAKGEVYGLSARGLAIKTGNPEGEEFPIFKTFWIERPAPNTTSIAVHALLDSPSAAGAFLFTIRPGDTTVFDSEVALYPRVDVTDPGFAPLTSMFLFDASGRAGVDDFRPEVHDSGGLAMHNGRDELLWRTLANPKDLQISAFVDVNPRGFGLLQRRRDFRDYEDLESRYEKRPSLWIEPIGNWGEGDVRLVEIPSKEEIHDNIVAFWRPRDPLRAKGEYNFTYRMHWGPTDQRQLPLAKIAATRSGAGGAPDVRLFVLDIEGDKLKEATPPEQVRGAVWASKGKVDHVVSQPNPATGGWRLSFTLAPNNEPVIELRAQLMLNDQPLSESWLYRWTT
ncbi:MAG TPA: glucan biosynthesis protein G [Xanthobacteraceae bacterium]|nr:glucan biosynthesis protein G [Xanthobacteraceae bacterium]